MKSSKNPRRKRLIIISLIVLAAMVIGVSLGTLWRPQTKTPHTTLPEPTSDELYELECERFDQVLENASDEELFLVLRYAIANGFVPNREIDPYFDMYFLVHPWQRSLRVYECVAHRTDLLRLIYPDLDVLDDYVRWGRHGEPYPDTVVAQTIQRNAQGDGQSLDSLMGNGIDENSLHYQFFATPCMWQM